LTAEARPRPATAARYQRLADSRRGTGGEKLADFLGFLSLGVGLAEVLAPEAVSRLVGVKEPDTTDTALVRAMGVREIASGVAILSNTQPRKSLWSRVIGDAVDVAFLGKTLANPANDRGRTLVAMSGVLAVSALDYVCAKQLQSQPEAPPRRSPERGIVCAHRSITIAAPVEEVYAFWRDFENLPRFMRHLESVEVVDARRSRWIAKAPAGKSVEWDAEIVEERENELIAWRSLPGGDVFNAGVVRFQPAPAERGTEVRVALEYRPPFGKLGSKIAMLWREEPRQQIADDLRRLKQVLEVGEPVVSDATKRRGMHPARPDEHEPER
jgi:uncharacterized membrane protein